jgi:hypothetical protein
LAAFTEHTPQPFDALEHDWALTCRQHRRSQIVANWAEAEPALTGLRRLADVIPPPGVDRTPVTAAVARLHVAGDDLATRTLLHLLVPGLIRLTALWRTRLPGGVTEAGWEVITRAGIYIALLRQRDIRCAPAGYVLRSVHRDLVLDAQTEHQHRTATIDLSAVADVPHGHQLVGPSAEDTVCAGPVVRLVLEEAAEVGIIPPDAVELVWLILTGHSAHEAAERTGYSLSTTYRYRSAAFTYLYQQLIATDTGADR